MAPIHTSKRRSGLIDIYEHWWKIVRDRTSIKSIKRDLRKTESAIEQLDMIVPIIPDPIIQDSFRQRRNELLVERPEKLKELQEKEGFWLECCNKFWHALREIGLVQHALRRCPPNSEIIQLAEALRVPMVRVQSLPMSP